MFNLGDPKNPFILKIMMIHMCILLPLYVLTLKDTYYLNKSEIAPISAKLNK